MPAVKLVVVKSTRATNTAGDPFSLFFDSACADRFAARLKSSIVHLIEVPAILPQYLEEPAQYLPYKFKPHDITLAINIHDELLLALPALTKASGGKAIVVPREDPNWTTPWLREEMTRMSAALDLEIAFPKPFCSLSEKPSHPAINAFIKNLKIGRPAIRFHVADGFIRRVEVLRSAPCGDTYYVAEKLKGKRLDDKLDGWAFKFWASYPCLGAMVFDTDYDDLLQHAAGHILLEAIEEARKAKE